MKNLAFKLFFVLIAVFALSVGAFAQTEDGPKKPTPPKPKPPVIKPKPKPFHSGFDTKSLIEAIFSKE